MIVFVEEISNRLKYTLDYILSERLGIDYQLCSNVEAFTSSRNPKINYSNKKLEGIWIKPVSLLFENDIKEGKPGFSNKDGRFYLFPSKESDSFHFDILAASFWLLSRYEEYQNYTPDKHQRFSASESLAFQQGFINRPVVDYWVLELKDCILKQYPNLITKQEQFEILPTIDVDSPWCYKHKGLIRNLGGSVRDLLNNNWSNLFYRWTVLLGLKNDPHFVFDALQSFYDQHHLKPLYFIHVGDYGSFDKTIAFYKRPFKLFLAHLSYNNKWGIHPSYQASESDMSFKRELKRLEKVSGEKVLRSRHHYLKIRLPQSYQFMINQGITDDYTMGFADKMGFRAGTSRPFLFFDLSQNEATSLRVHPFVVMDRTLNTYEQFTEEEVLHALKEIVDTIKEVNGTFVSLWHNESLSDYQEWKGWKSIYEKMLKMAMDL